MQGRLPIHPNQIGGARVERTFTMGDKRLLAGHLLTGDEVRSIPAVNRSSLIDRGFLMPWPKDAGAGPGMPPQASVRFVRPLGFGRYDVIEGRKLNEDTLTKEQAHELAGIPLPPANGGDKVN